MRSISILDGLALASSALVPAGAMTIGHGRVIVISDTDRLGTQVAVNAAAVEAATIEVRRALPRDGQRRRRAKGPQAKPRKRSNRQHVSKRTRRKHRRAA